MVLNCSLKRWARRPGRRRHLKGPSRRPSDEGNIQISASGLELISWSFASLLEAAAADRQFGPSLWRYAQLGPARRYLIRNQLHQNPIKNKIVTIDKEKRKEESYWIQIRFRHS